MNRFPVFAVVLGLAAIVMTESAAQTPMQLYRSAEATPYYRMIVTYNGQVSLATEHYDVMGNGRVVFKEDGMRFGAGYFWSPAIHDQIVRQGRYTNRIVGTPTKFWPPVVEPTITPAAPRQMTPSTLKIPQFSGRVQVTRRPAPATTVLDWNSGILGQVKHYDAGPIHQMAKPLPTASYMKRLPDTTFCPPLSAQPQCMNNLLR